MIQELQTFRNQYPQYNDLDDLMLAKLLAGKYPEYEDILDKASLESTKKAIPPELAVSHGPGFQPRKPSLTEKLEGLGQEAYKKIWEFAQRETGPGETLRSIGTVYGPIEAAASLISNIWGVPAIGIAEIIKLAGGPEWLPEKVGEATIYQPRTEAGRQLTEVGAYPWAKLQEVSESIADYIREQTGSPLAATAGGTIAEILGILGIAKGISKGIPARPAKGKPLEWPKGEPFIDRGIPIAPELEKPALPPGQGFILKEKAELRKAPPVKDPEIFVRKTDGTYTPGFWDEGLGRYVTPIEEAAPGAKGLPAGQGFVTKPTPPKTILRPEEYKPKGKGPVEISPEGEPIYPPGMKPVVGELPKEITEGKGILPEWARTEMEKRGLKPNRLLNDVDVSNPSIAEALAKDPIIKKLESTNPELAERAKQGNVTAEELRQALAEPQKVIPEPTKVTEEVPKPATFRQFVESKGYDWPIKATKPEYLSLKAEFDALKGEKPKPEEEVPEVKPPMIEGTAYVDWDKVDVLGKEKPPKIEAKPTAGVTEPEYTVVARREAEIANIKTLEDVRKAFESGQLDYQTGRRMIATWENLKEGDLTKYNEFWEEATKGYKISKGKETVTVRYGRKWDPEAQEWKTDSQTFRVAMPEERQVISGEGVEFLGWTTMPGAMGEAGIKKFREIAKADKQFAENPVLRLERIPEGEFRLIFTAKDAETGMPRRYRIAPEVVSKGINDLIESKTLKEGEYIRLSPGYLEGKSSEIYLAKKGLESLIDKYYEEGLRREKEFKKKGEIALPRISIEFPAFRETIEKAKSIPKGIKEKIDTFRFYPKLPMEFRNAIRNEVIGGVDKARDKTYNRVAHAIWGGMKKADVEKSVEVIFARDQLSRAKLGKGNPDISIDEAQRILTDIEKGASKPALDAGSRYREITEGYQKDLVERGILEPDQLIEDYAPHYVVDYTPDWAFSVGIPTRLKRPFRGYKKPALGTSKEYMKDSDAILGHFLKIEHDNLIEDFIQRQASKYDILPKISAEKQVELFGAEKTGKPKVPKPGTIREIEGERYRVYTPDIPFSRQLFPTEEGLMALGRYKRTYVLPENIYNAFMHFSDRGNAVTYWTNRATSYWKSAAILSHFPSFNVNNLIGDTWMAMVQHPKPLKFLGEMDTSLKYLTGKGKEGYFKDLDSFIKNQNVLQGTFTQTELARVRKSPNPARAFLQGAYKVSEFRESINRTAYASSLLKEMKEGRGEEIRKAHSWIHTEGLPLEDALGKISRDVLVDYGWVNRSFHRYIRGMAFPFATWYFKASPLLWRWTQKNWGKALMGFMGLPLAAVAYNNRDEKTKEMESRLPDYVRHRVHFVLGENPDKTTRVWSLQLPQDVLVGTKIFSIATDYANRVANKEMPVKEAAIRTLKDWGIQEAKGVAYLTGPMIRFISGLASADKRDPYDNSPIYSMKPEYMTWQRRLKDQSLFFIKSSVPFLSTSIQNYERGLPKDVAFNKLLDNLAGKGALGIYDVNPKGQVKIGGKLYEYDDIARINWIRNKEMGYLGDLENDFVASAKPPKDFINTPEAKDSLLKIYNLWSDFVPDMKKEEDENVKIGVVSGALGKRLTNRLTDLSTLQRWQRVKLERAKTDEEKKKLGAEFQELRKRAIAEEFKRRPKTARETEILQRIKDHKLPWNLILELP